MATHKRIDGDYNVTTINPEDYFYITTHTVQITGNLDVVGNVTYIETTELKVDDPFITVAANNSGTLGTALFPDQGLVAQSSGNTWAGIRFDNAANTWQISSSVYANGDPIDAYTTIATAAGTTPGGANTSIQFNDSSSFGGSTEFTFDKATNQMGINGTLALGNQPQPSQLAGNSVIYSNTVGGGGTGVYFVSGPTSDELVSKTAAITYAIIF